MEDRLQKFAALVDCGSFTKAAQTLHISQPALSTAIHKLERELKCELLIRHSRQLELTPAGRFAYQAARDMQLASANLRRQIADAAGTDTILHVGMIDSIAERLCIGPEAPIEQAALQLSLTVDNTGRLVNYVAKGDLELALATKPTHVPQGIVTKDIGEEQLVLVAASERADVVQRLLADGRLEDFIGYNQQSYTYQFIAAYFTARHVSIAYSFYSTSPHIMLEFVLANKGVAVLPQALVASAITANQLVAIPLQPTLTRTISSIYREGQYRSQQLNRIEQLASERLAAVY